MSHAGGYLKSAVSIFNSLEESKPHSSITDWVEVLSSDRYEEMSLDGIPELVESINIQGSRGTQEAARAIRKKLKYGNVHRQLRALVILRALTENAGKGFQLNWADQQILGRLKDMAQDSLIDPKVKKRLILVFHAWSIQYKDEPRMTQVANLYRQYSGHVGPAVKRPAAGASATSTITAARGGSFNETDALYNHSWAPGPGQRGADTYADLAAAKADAEARKREREGRIALEQREAEIERKERELRRKQDMASIEARRQREAAEEAERRRKMKEDSKKKPAQQQRPKFDLQKEKPQIMVSIANAIQAASVLVNACRHINREYENVTESPKVQDALDKAKAARRVIIRYIQVVTDETLVGTLLDANEKLSKPAVLDSDSDDEPPKDPTDPKEMEALSRRMEAQKLEADRTGELHKLQERQKRESAKRQQRRTGQTPKAAVGGYAADLQDLDFGGAIANNNSRLPPPMSPDSDRASFGAGSLSDYSDYDYDSSEDEWRAAHPNRKPAHQSSAGPSRQASSQRPRDYAALDEETGTQGRHGLLDPNDPFGDPFADEQDTPVQEKPRMQWTEI
ncbi:hypothetical protein JCM24511_06405 [Saitozyma sp. JCM 24511]|nr:hypothetical protein JCM24511_06405 [Saitozyma sp. JCM 24511]